MKVIFLDIDGVLNSQRDYFGTDCRNCHDGLNQNKLDMINGFSATYGYNIIITSSWRISESNMSLLKKYIRGISGKTPELDGQARGCEIAEWLKDHPDVKDFIVLDDEDDDCRRRFGDRFIRTSTYNGLDNRTMSELEKRAKGR